MITINEFLFSYRLKASTHYGFFELLPWDRKSRYFFIFGLGWETLFDDFWREIPRLLQKWEVPMLGAYFCDPFLFFFRALVSRLTKFVF